MKIAFVTLSMILSVAVSSSQEQVNGRATFEKSDKRLNDAFQLLIAAKRSDSAYIKNLRSSQRILIQFRDAELKLMYPNPASVEKDTFLPMTQAIYLSRITDERANVLLERLRAATNGLVTYDQFANRMQLPSFNYNNYNPNQIYISDLKIIHSDNIQDGINLDRPYWTNELIICGKKYRKGIILNPKEGGIVGSAEFLLPRMGGHLLGIAGWAEEIGATHQGKMRFRILADGKLLHEDEIVGTESKGLDLDLGQCKVLRIEIDDGLDGNTSDHMAFGDLRIVYY